MGLRITHVLGVCARCMFIAVNGDDPDPDHNSVPSTDVWSPSIPIPGTEHNCEPWSKAPEGHACMGVEEHSEECTQADRDEGCDCGDLGFCRYPCDACGCTLHGDRYSFVILGEESDA